MIYVTGDMHGNLEKLKAACAKLKKNDTLIICGDFGFIWDGGAAEKRLLKRLGKGKYNLCFLDGSNENFYLLAGYPEAEFMGGRARNVSGRLWHLMRGEVYTIEEKKIFIFGGGESADVDSKRAQNRWYPEEMPSMEEMQRGADNLEKAGLAVDYILTHIPPGSVLAMMEKGNPEYDNLQIYLNEVAKRVKFERWIFGRMHKDRVLTPHYTAVFDQVIPLNPPDKKKRKTAAKADKVQEAAVQ